MPWSIFFIITGIVLQHNDSWFNGAETVGTVSLWFGIITLAVQILVLVFAGIMVKNAERRF
jgi:hypothetical protein